MPEAHTNLKFSLTDKGDSAGTLSSKITSYGIR